MSDRLASFIALSALLTGFNAVKLRGTGMGEDYQSLLDQIVSIGTVDDQLSSIEPLPSGHEGKRPTTEEILEDPRLGPIARNLIILWYSGSWPQLPAAWRVAFGASPMDTTHVVSGAAYQAGLQWAAAGAHPAGAKPQGFGAWSLEPQGRRA
ncbi:MULTISPECIES: hypothetical protein [Rhizobium]|uniref:Membrane bound FAD containing D-sorbitol dehydrogenase n=1 Tax=Rhizobium favelukesii TaxID=348824 RepID=W6RMW1_9HYPH|nr:MULTISPECIES: hypothetical protein [Rhizobium]MCS0463482.1 hypothetical protein [Rhizobium favelukesii]UFS84676.1 hypothetical protein LPB79_32960 [Rhizobium sp. T136]CDM60268.1 hypothetical protein LPU83_pLPU83b_0278 [Rhizobium favelukesii]